MMKNKIFQHAENPKRLSSMIKLEKTHIAIIAIIILMIISAIILYPKIPNNIITHWDINGKADGHMPTFWGLFLFPIISIFLVVLLFLIPLMDPLKVNIQKFQHEYNKIVLLIILFMAYIYILMILWNLNFKFNMIQAMIPGFSVLFYYIGISLGEAKRNWSIGIRTPWTLSSEKVWNKTHQLASKLFRLIAIIILWGVVFPKYAIWFFIIPILLAAIIPVIYSYIEYRKLV